ncbi:MAG: phage portal protein, partial [Solimonas sp.]
LDVKELSMTAADAQLLESRQWQVVDIARAFGVPPFMIAEMGKATYNNTENLGTDFVKYTLNPHLMRWQQELNFKLFMTARFFTEYNTNALMRADVKTRGDYYKAALGGTQSPGWMTPNEVRRLENDAPIEGGNTLFRPKEKTDAQPEEPAPEAAPTGDEQRRDSRLVQG